MKMLQFFKSPTVKKFLTVSALASYNSRIAYKLLNPKQSEDTIPATEELTNHVNKLAKEMGLNPPVKVFQYPNKSGLKDSATGVYIPYLWNSMAIDVSQEEFKNDWAIRHEISHLKSQDPAANFLILLGIQIFGFALKNKISFKYFLPAAYAIIDSFQRYCEKKSDLVAAKYSNYIEIAGIITYFNKEQQNNRDDLTNDNDKDKNLEMKILCNKDGDIRALFDVHPKYSTRIKYLSNILDQRNLPKPEIKVYIQQANGEESKYDLSREESETIRTMIKNSEKRFIYGSLEKIVIIPSAKLCNVRLYVYGQGIYFSPFDFESSSLQGKLDILGIIKSILSVTTRLTHFSTGKDVPIAEVQKESPKFYPNHSAGVNCILLDDHQFEHDKNHYVVYTKVGILTPEPIEKEISLQV